MFMRTSFTIKAAYMNMCGGGLREAMQCASLDGMTGENILLPKTVGERILASQDISKLHIAKSQMKCVLAWMQQILTYRDRHLRHVHRSANGAAKPQGPSLGGGVSTAGGRWFGRGDCADPGQASGPRLFCVGSLPGRHAGQRCLWRISLRLARAG